MPINVPFESFQSDSDPITVDGVPSAGYLGVRATMHDRLDQCLDALFGDLATKVDENGNANIDFYWVCDQVTENQNALREIAAGV